jgi:hypothetical protein
VWEACGLETRRLSSVSWEGEGGLVLEIIAHRSPSRRLCFHSRKFLSNSVDNRPGDRLSMVLQRLQ